MPCREDLLAGYLEISMKRASRAFAMAAAIWTMGMATSAQAVTTTFFSPEQTATLIASGTTSDTISSEGYLFTYTMDKLFTGGVGLTEPIGRFVTVSWPAGVQAQAVTSGPVTGPAQITLSRLDGNVFDLSAMTFKLLANTGGAGASLEVMPVMNGEDALNDPIALGATGYYGEIFSYLPALYGYEAYKFSLYVDFALTGLTLVDASVAPPPIPEPSTYALLAAGLLVVSATVRRSRLG